MKKRPSLVRWWLESSSITAIFGYRYVAHPDPGSLALADIVRLAGATTAGAGLLTYRAFHPATQPSTSLAEALPGFLTGFVHGALILFSFVASWFTDLRIYASPNSGGWYDSGYVLGSVLLARVLRTLSGMPVKQDPHSPHSYTLSVQQQYVLKGAPKAQGC